MEILAINKTPPVHKDFLIPLAYDDVYRTFSYHRRYLSSISFIIRCDITVCFWLDTIETVKDDNIRMKMKAKFDKAFHEALKEFMFKNFSKGGSNLEKE